MPPPRAHDLRARRVDDVPEGELIAGRLGERPVSTVFLDRDGTLNVKAPEGSYVRRPSELVLLPGAGPAVARLNAAGVTTVLVTNQRWLSRPGVRYDDYRATHGRLTDLLAADGARLDAAYHCPHDRGACDCRKPAPGMLLRAAVDLGVDLHRAVIVGDAESDLAAGRGAGTGALLISSSLSGHPDADAVVPDLRSAVDLLLAGRPAERPDPGEGMSCAVCG